MKLIKLTALFGSLAGCLLLSQAGWSQVTVNPFGYAVYAEAEDTLSTEFSLHNGGENEVTYDIRLRGGNNNVRRLAGPRRDDPGDVLQEIELEHTGALGISRDFVNGTIWVTHTIIVGGQPTEGFFTEYEWDGREVGDVLTDIRPEQPPLGGTYFDGILYATVWQNPFIMRYDVEGNRLDNFNLNAMTPMGYAVDPETGYLYCIIFNTVNIIVLEIDDNLNQVANIPNILGRGNDGDFRARMCWVPEHESGHIWISHEFAAHQLSINEDWESEEVQSFRVESDIRSFGIGHDGENLWMGNSNANVIFVTDDGIIEPNWLTIDPETGVIAGGEDAVISALIIPEGLEQGVYDLIVDATFDDETLSPIQMSIVLSFESLVADISGIVVQPGSDERIPNIEIALGEYLISRGTDDDGAFMIEDLPVGNYTLTASAPDYLPTTVEVELDDDGVDLRIELYHAEFNLSTDHIETDLAPDSETHVNFTASNDGNGPCTWSVERRLPGDANAAPWELRREINVAQILDDDRIEGVAFAGENFYFSGANRDNPNTIYITNIDGEPTGSFIQPGESRYGMKDLEWDGELLWGSGEQRIFGFDTEGNIEHEFAGPFNPNGNIAYDTDREVLWISGTTTDIAGYTRDGQAAGVRLNRKTLRIYGLAYWPDDPDGFPLYIVNSPAAGVINIHKMNPENGDTMLARSLQPPEGASAGGAFISNMFDVYSWVLITMNNITPDNGGDRAQVYHLDARRDWFIVDPTEGVIQAGEAQEFDLHLNAAGLPAVAFEGELFFTHTGIGSASSLPIRLNVVDGPVIAQRNILLNFGWNLISTNIQPDPDDIVEITRDLVEAGILDMVKDDRGRFYRPASRFSNLAPWLVSEGYWLKLSDAGELSLEGMSVAADEPMDLFAGWQAISYYPRVPVNAVVALSGIVDVLVIAKDGFGNFYLPAFHFTNMGNMREGRGYQVRVSRDVQLIYRLEEERQASPSPMKFVSVHDTPGRYAPPSITGRSMCLLVTSDMADGTDIGVYADDALVGCGVVASGMAGVAAWGDDPSTPALDGAREGDPLTFRVRDDAGERPASVTLTQGDLTYKTDDFSVVAVNLAAIPTVFGLTEAYPNPFNSRMKATFGLPAAGPVQAGLFDLSGREVLHLLSGNIPAGYHRLSVSGEFLASGVYFLRVEAARNRSQLKIALVK